MSQRTWRIKCPDTGCGAILNEEFVLEIDPSLENMFEQAQVDSFVTVNLIE
jgi:hypothetical protein